MSSSAESSMQRPSDSPQATSAAARLLADRCAAALGAGGLVVVVDDKGEGTLLAAAEKATPDLVTTMLTHGRGMISVCLTAERCRQLGLFRRGGDDPRAHAQPYVTSVDAVEDVTTGISAADRSRTIRALADPALGREALREPGHVFVLRAREGGVAERAGHTEAAIELAVCGGSAPAGVICEILDGGGALASVPDQIAVCERLGIPLIHIADLVTVLPAAPARIIEDVGIKLAGRTWRAVRLREGDGRLATDHLALMTGDPTAAPPRVAVTATRPLTRLLGRDEHGLAPDLAGSGEPAVLIALGPRWDLARASRELEGDGPTPADERSVAGVLRALEVREVRIVDDLDSDSLERHGIRARAVQPEGP